MAHFLPVLFDWKVGMLVGSVAPVELKPVNLYQPFVEATVIEAKAGTIITLTNWSTQPVKELKVMVQIPVPTNNVSLASGNAVQVEKNGEKTTFTLDLEVADTLILR